MHTKLFYATIHTSFSYLLLLHIFNAY